MWMVPSCEGAFPSTFQVQWNSDSDRGMSQLLPSATQYIIHGLSNGTLYNITLILSDDCGNGSIHTGNSSTLSEGMFWFWAL